ncbi:isocitrate lyase/PEP mutase family protein [Antarctobacter heliothermus]|uniref:2-Methylisocitrate lyase, PEP mutase family n=1 Tax=Antarctobacter heliothermus TaxID=74033 RepID=A0A239GS51_9RHOB|nr:isocitrate lyase/phosphoenolpyruvate mutase family protein [Antarctobacter heliothermus]SNS72039.1 2-Methylisocitrate lyase, PEP mutase family [Antarctobacter heliothermus]
MPDSFRDMHRPGSPFILANAWDAGSARMLVALGAKAIGTSSAAHAFTLGRPDTGTITRDEALAHAQSLVSAVNVPVSGDFENGFGEAPETCAETVRLAAEVGLAGICIEDTALPGDTPYDASLSTERIRAAASAARALPRDFFLVAQADGILTGHYNTDEAITRIRAFEAAGTDAVYVPAPPSMEALGRLVQATNLPFNALVSGPFAKHSRAEFAALGVARLSLGSALARATYRTIHTAGKDMFGTNSRFDTLSDALPFDVLDPMLK